MKLLFFATLFYFSNPCRATIPCRLVFQQATTESKIPLAPVGAENNADLEPELNNYVARFDDSGQTVGGRWSVSGEALAYNGNQVKKGSSFELLTNPHNCSLRWARELTRLSVRYSETEFVGRTIRNEFLPGSVSSIGSGINFVNGNEQGRNDASFEILESYSDGIAVKQEHFQMQDEDIFFSTDFLGMDTILNDSPATVRQKVSHKKVVSQTINIVPDSQLSTGVTSFRSIVQLNFNGIGGPSFEINQNYQAGSDGSVSKTEETTLTTEREVVVPEYTSVHICSTISIAEDFDARYTATYVASANGLSPEEIHEELRGAGENWRIVNGRVVTEDSGRITGTVATNTQFTVSEASSGQGCSQARMLIKEAKRLQKSGNILDKQLAADKYNQIQNILNRGF